jgi:predicted nucleic acid-binding protein
VILPDLNLLVYAYNEDAPLHSASKAWWETCLSGAEPVGLAWVVLLGFARLMSSRRVLLKPMLAREAL